MPTETVQQVRYILVSCHQDVHWSTTMTIFLTQPCLGKFKLGQNTVVCIHLSKGKKTSQ